MSKLTNSQLNRLATALARKYAQATDEQDDFIQEGLWAYTKATQRRIVKGKMKNGICARVWAIADEVLKNKNTTPSDVYTKCEGEGIHPSTCRVQFGHYCRETFGQSPREKWGVPKRIISKRQVINNPFAFARTVMQRAMISYSQKVNQRSPDTEQLYPNTAAVHTSIDERLWLEQYLEALESQHGRQIRTVAANLVDPTDKRVCQFILKETRAKQRAERRGCSVRGTDRIRLSRRQVQEALGYNTNQWHSVRNTLRAFTAQWLHLVGEGERVSRYTLTTR